MYDMGESCKIIAEPPRPSSYSGVWLAWLLLRALFYTLASYLHPTRQIVI